MDFVAGKDVMQVATDVRGFERSVAFLSTYPPQQCGLATYTFDLRASTPGRHSVVAVSDETIDHPAEVELVIDKHDRMSYLQAANTVNAMWEAVCLQHEFGIFGGKDGEHILAFLENLRVPVLVTCHTLLQRPSPNQMRVLTEVCRLATSVMVMSDRASDILEGIYGVSCEKIVVIPHGVPDSEGVSPAAEMAAFGDDPKLLTFGLLNPGKGIEVAIDAVAQMKRRKRNVRYFVLGATHPALKRREGEEYRNSLLERVHRLELQENVIFVDEYVDLPRLCQFLAGTDVYVTPYVGKEQVVSGTLSYAMSFGLPVISTPFVYAEELADKGAAVLLPFGDSMRLAQLAERVLDDPKFRGRLKTAASHIGRTMRWPVIGKRIDECLAAMHAAHHRAAASLI